MKPLLYSTCFMLLLLFTVCKSRSNERSVSVDDLDKAIAEEKQTAAPGPSRSILTAKELMELAACKDIDCVQLYMKDRSNDFVHAKKGEFASLYRSAVKDTSGNTLVIPMSTFYVAVDPGATWRMAHTVHTKELSDQLMSEFAAAKFVVADSVLRGRNFRYHYTSSQYPGLGLYQYMTFSPWRTRGLYYTVNWPCYVFEVYQE